MMTALLQEIISVYPLLMPSSLTAAASNRVCNALALLQCVASHNETRALFLSGWYSSVSEVILFMSKESSAHSPISISIPQHNFKVPPLRVPTSYIFGCHWRSREERFFRCYQLPLVHGDHPSMPQDHGDRIRVVENSGHFHCAEDPARRYGTGIYMSDI